MAKKKAKKEAAEQPAEGEETVKPKKKGGFLFQIVMAVVLGVTSFGAVYLMPEDEQTESHAAVDCAPAAPVIVELEPDAPALDEIVFVEMDALVVSLGRGNSARHLKIGLTLETVEAYEGEIHHATPKLKDAFTGYLRAVRLSQLQDPAAMARIRSQLLRRAQVVLGDSAINGLLITDFILT